MYKTKPRFRCHMPSDAPLKVLALNASLKHEPTVSKEHGHQAYGEGPRAKSLYYARMLKARPQTLVPGKATCCEMHANLEAPA